MEEEYAYLGMNGFERGAQGLGRCGERLCDVIEATNPDTGEKRTFYFDGSIPTAHLRQSLGGEGGAMP